MKGRIFMKNAKMNKHLSFEDRCVIEEYLNHNFNFSQIANHINKYRTTIARDVKKHRYLGTTNSCNNQPCCFENKPPYVCNGCSKFNNCRKIRYSYSHDVTFNEYKQNLINTRANLRITKEEIASINDTISPLMINKHHSVNHVYISHPELLPFSKSTFYKYIDLGILNVRNIDLNRRVKFKVKKEYDYMRDKVDTKVKIGRFYSDFKYYMEFNPNASIVEMDTVIGTRGGKGGKCMLTLLFRKYNFMLIYLLPYKQAKYVNTIFNILKSRLGNDEFKRLFEVILTDNGTEFSDPESIEINPKTGEKLCSIFYCDPNCSWQKGSIEKNHEYIRYILPKGTSFADLSQNDCYLMASHINSIPRLSLNNVSPYEEAYNFIGRTNIDKLHIKKIEYDDIDLTIRLLKK
ncbi:MAG: IS30 family transposase [Firmicutes bacterium]|nr:IS30 family transposase [Bacillota bacterium]